MKPTDPITCEIIYNGKSLGLATWCPHCQKGFSNDDHKTRCPHCGAEIEEDQNMKKWYFTASTDGNNIDFETTIHSEKEPSFWTCQDLAEENGCTLWSIEEIRE